MSNIFSLGEMDNFSDQIDLDDLYEKKREHDLSQLYIFNKLFLSGEWVYKFGKTSKVYSKVALLDLWKD